MPPLVLLRLDSLRVDISVRLTPHSGKLTPLFLLHLKNANV